MKKSGSLICKALAIMLLPLYGCNKDKEEGPGTDPRLDYHPVMLTSEYNEEVWNKEIYAYESEHLTIVEDYDYDFGAAELDEKEMYTYPDENTIELDYYDMSTNPPESDSRKVMTLADGKITQIISHFSYTDLWGETHWLILAKDVFTYSGEQLMDLKQYWYEDDNVWDLYSQTTYQYEEGRILEIWEYESNDAGGLDATWSHHFEYADKQISQIITRYASEAIYRRVPQYEGGRVASDITYVMSSGSWEPYYISEYQYDVSGNCTQEKETYYGTQEEYTSRYTYEKGKSNFWTLKRWPGALLMDFSRLKSTGPDGDLVRQRQLNGFLLDRY